MESMLAKLEQFAAPATAAQLKGARHILLVLPRAAKLEALREVPFADTLATALARRKKEPGELAKSPLTADLPQGALAAWVMLDAAKSAFERQTLLRKAIGLLLSEKPAVIDI